MKPRKTLFPFPKSNPRKTQTQKYSLPQSKTLLKSYRQRPREAMALVDSSDAPMSAVNVSGGAIAGTSTSGGEEGGYMMMNMEFADDDATTTADLMTQPHFDDRERKGRESPDAAFITENQSEQTIMRLTTQCNEKDFELEIKAVDNRILQEHLQTKCAENQELQERIKALEQQPSFPSGDNSSLYPASDEYVEDLKKKIQSEEIENEKLKLEHVQFQEENSGLRVQNQKLSEEASYAKELASAAAVELKNLAVSILITMR